MTHRNSGLSGPPRSKFLRLQATKLKIKASSGLTSSWNSKVVKDTTGEDLISTSLQLGSKCRIRSCGWVSAAQREPAWSSSSTQCQRPSAEHCSDFLLVIFARTLYAAPAMHRLKKNIYVCWKGFPCAWQWLFACAANTPHTSSRLTSAHSTGHYYVCACTLSQSWALGDN